VLAEELAMVSLLMESVVISFALGGVVGAVIAVHLLYRKKGISRFSGQEDGALENQSLLQREIDVRIKIPPRH
jgi:hypothetical protein